MKRNRPFLIFIAFIFTTTPSFAFFCPTNFNQIFEGDTLEQVKTQCGAPAKEVTSDEKKNVPQEWTYFIPQTVTMSNNMQTEGTLKTSISFDQSGNAINISVNGIGVGSTTICGGSSIQLGDNQEAIKSRCGKPSFINKQQADPPAEGAAPPSKVTELTYQSNPPVVLQFLDGRLTGKK